SPRVTEIAQSVRPTPSPRVTASAPTISTPNSIAKKNAEQEVAYQALTTTLAQAQNGCDSAFADANATWLQSNLTAGKDRVALKAALDAYRASVAEVTTACNHVITQAKQTYKAALASINGK
ncbi:MAG TPA: hypothetical protein VIH79_03175, partial [Candidatus Nanopelagicaceae bacterium]